MTGTDWIFPFQIDDMKALIDNYAGFVYIIDNRFTDKFYIGQKTFWNHKKLPPLKGKKRIRHKKVESDWKDYWGSSQDLIDDIEIQGKDTFNRRIVKLCKRKSEMNYEETKLQFYYDVLRNPKSYNKIINCRISQNQLGSK